MITVPISIRESLETKLQKCKLGKLLLEKLFGSVQECWCVLNIVNHPTDTTVDVAALYAQGAMDWLTANATTIFSTTPPYWTSPLPGGVPYGSALVGTWTNGAFGYYDIHGVFQQLWLAMEINAYGNDQPDPSPGDSSELWFPSKCSGYQNTFLNNNTAVWITKVQIPWYYVQEYATKSGPMGFGGAGAFLETSLALVAAPAHFDGYMDVIVAMPVFSSAYDAYGALAYGTLNGLSNVVWVR